MDTVEVTRLASAAQQGNADQVRQVVEARMVELCGSIKDGPPGLHYVRAVAFQATGDYRAALAAGDLMLAAAERDGDAGWRSNALALRAATRTLLGDGDLAEYDIDAVLRDLAAAEATLAGGIEDLCVAANAHVAVGICYHRLRLYELAEPHYAAGYDLASRYADPDLPAICQVNLADLHLQWALELYRIGDFADADKHNLIAESHASRVGRDCAASDTYWHDQAALCVGCARADGDDPAGAAAQIRTYGDRIRASGRVDMWLVCVPFLAIALAGAGRHEEALAVTEQALAELPAESGEWLTAAALTHTQAVLLVQTGAPQARAVLRYGDRLAGALWRERLRTLHTAEALRSYEQLRAEHDRLSRSADTDALTGVPNRRAFDRELARLASGGGTATTAVLIIDLDKLKPLNDASGHATGDKALRAVAAALTGQLRGRDLLARIGGDEFCAVLEGTDTDEAVEVADRIVRAVRSLDLTITVSVGIATGPNVAIHDTLHRADRAMYVAKGAGGDRTSTVGTG
jgi:diguanylate cyclase (GGDEF)-like protein